jgi:hypothetical protein
MCRCANATNVSPNSKEQTMFYLKQAGVGLLSGLIAGLVLGIGARFAMRAVALAAHRATEFSVEGTLMIVLIGCILGLISGPGFVAARRRLPRSQVWSGPLYGVLVLLVLIPLMPPPIQQEITQSSDRLPLIIGLFGLVFIAYGMTLQSIVARLSPPAMKHSDRRSNLLGSNS